MNRRLNSVNYTKFLQFHNSRNFGHINDIKVKVNIRDPRANVDIECNVHTIEKIYYGGNEIRYGLWLDGNNYFTQNTVYYCKFINIGKFIIFNEKFDIILI